ncbi:MAG: PHB depolymerase family esterase [Verrucomicrobiota bacterium]
MVAALVGAEESVMEKQVERFGRLNLRFEALAPYGASSSLMQHLGHRLPVPEYELAQERFEAIVPSAYATNSAWGLFVWISPSAELRLPQAWEPVLAKRQLLLVSALNAGNDRHAIQRCRLALDAACNMCRRYAIDPQRIYVGGLSGGGRIASILGVAYADLFSGTISICGADFYRPVPAAPRDVYPPSYQPDPRVLLRAKAHGRFVLLTGEKDVNRDNTKSVANHGFTANGFQNIRYMEVAGMGHELPDAAVLDAALEFLDRQPIRP